MLSRDPAFSRGPPAATISAMRVLSAAVSSLFESCVLQRIIRNIFTPLAEERTSLAKVAARVGVLAREKLKVESKRISLAAFDELREGHTVLLASRPRVSRVFPRDAFLAAGN